MTSSGRLRAGRRPECPRDTLLAINVIVGLAVVVVAAFASVVVPASASGVRLALVALALAGFTAVAVDVTAAAVVTVLAYLVLDGFLVNELGKLTWRGAPDVWRTTETQYLRQYVKHLRCTLDDDPRPPPPPDHRARHGATGSSHDRHHPAAGQPRDPMGQDRGSAASGGRRGRSRPHAPPLHRPHRIVWARLAERWAPSRPPVTDESGSTNAVCGY